MKILITGVNGLLGSKLFELYENSNHTIIPTSRNIEGYATVKLDITLSLIHISEPTRPERI